MPDRASLGSRWASRAWMDAQAEIKRLDKGWLRRAIKETAKIDDPVDRARRVAELTAPADMALLVAIRHGLDPDTARDNIHQLRLIADIASRSLSIVGLRAGDVQQFEVSDRFREFLERWQGGDAQPAKIIEGRAERLPEAPSGPGAPGDGGP